MWILSLNCGKSCSKVMVINNCQDAPFKNVYLYTPHFSRWTLTLMKDNLQKAICFMNRDLLFFVNTFCIFMTRFVILAALVWYRKNTGKSDTFKNNISKKNFLDEFRRTWKKLSNVMVLTFNWLTLIWRCFVDFIVILANCSFAMNPLWFELEI